MNTETIRAELQKLNIAEVARRAGVTRQALSRFIHSPGRGLRSTSADRVIKAMHEMRAEQAKKNPTGCSQSGSTAA